MQDQRGGNQQEEQSEIKSNTGFQQLLAEEALKAGAKLREETICERQTARLKELNLSAPVVRRTN